MKNIVLLIALLGFLIPLQSQQSSFLKITDNDTLVFTNVYNSDLSYIFSHEPEKYVAITININDLTNASQYDFSRLKELVSVHIQFTISPDSSDESKQRYVKTINSILNTHISSFLKCPKLDNIVFGIGEQIYLNKEQVKMSRRETRKNELYYKRISEENLKTAWTETGILVQNKVPGIKIYAYDWGW